MTLKNWKRKQNSDLYTIYLRKDFFRSVQIIKNPTVLSGGRAYRVVIEGRDIKTDTTHFKTKAQALKFAQTYMKKH